MLAGDTPNVWEDVELIIDPDPFCTLCQISSMNKKARSKMPLKPEAPFKWVFMDIIPSIAPKLLTSDRNCSNFHLIVDAYSKNLKLYGMDKRLLFYLMLMIVSIGIQMQILENGLLIPWKRYSM